MNEETQARIESIQKATGVAALAFGAAGVFTPRLLGSAYGLKDRSPDYIFLARLWGSRTAAFGALAFGLQPGEARRMLSTASAAMNGLDALVALATTGLPARTRVQAALTSSFFAAAAGYAATHAE